MKAAVRELECVLNRLKVSSHGGGGSMATYPARKLPFLLPRLNIEMQECLCVKVHCVCVSIGSVRVGPVFTGNVAGR